ncbi:MAG: VOC family protein [Anaerolineaceae bacterium]
MSLFKNVNVVSYYVTDWEKAKKFYQDTLEWPVVFSSDEAGWVEFGRENETHISINRWDGPEPVPPKLGGATAVFSVDDAIETTKLLRARGVRCEDAITIPGMVCYGTLYDLEGNRLQFASNVSE